MQFEYSIFPEKALITTRLKGNITADDLLKSYHQLVSNPGFDHEHDLLGDMSEGIFVSQFEEHINANNLVKQDIPPNTGRTALITDTAIESALCILLKKSLEGTREVEIFCTREAAEKWLGIEK